MTFEFKHNPLSMPQIGAFDWTMGFKWIDVPSDMAQNWTYTNPIPSPAMAGGLFTVYKKTFIQLGSYDRSEYVNITWISFIYIILMFLHNFHCISLTVGWKYGVGRISN